MEVINWKELLYPYQQTVEELLVKFHSIQKECKNLGVYCPIESVSGRVKKAASIMDKIARKQVSYEKMEQEIEDIAGIRILCQFVEDIYKVIDMIKMRNGRDMEIVEEKDYVKNKKPSGYQSYHIIIKYPLNTAFGYKEVMAEIQIRTLAMNFWATAEHSLRYKYSGNIPDSIQERLTNCADAAFRLDTEMSTIRGEIINAQQLNEIKQSLVNNILENIQNLYFVAKLDDMNKINKEFIDLWGADDVDKLRESNEKLNIMAELYRI